VEEDNVVAYQNPGVSLPVADALTEVLRAGARRSLQKQKLNASQSLP